MDKMSLSHNFFPPVWHFFYLLPWQHWCCFGCPLWVRWLHSDHMSPLFTWNCETKVDEVHSAALIYQNLEISSFCVLGSTSLTWVTTSHQHTNIMTWNEANDTDKIFLSNIKYLKLLRICSPAINIKILVKFPLVRLCQVFHGSGLKSYFNTRTIGKLLCLHSNAQNFMYFMFICICVRWIWNGSFLVRKGS